MNFQYAPKNHTKMLLGIGFVAIFTLMTAGIQAIRKALKDERLTMFYQPIYKVGSDLSEIAHLTIWKLTAH
ncbi:MAG: hypothetical protein ACI9XK_005015 [Granulosicoccus sp.]|jgi:hypothetical protein